MQNANPFRIGVLSLNYKGNAVVAIAESNHGHADFQFRNSQFVDYNRSPKNQLAFRDNKYWKAAISVRDEVFTDFRARFPASRPEKLRSEKTERLFNANLSPSFE